MRIVYTFFLQILCIITLQAQTISGYVEDAQSGERLIGATLRSGTQGKNTNRYGFFSLPLQTGPVELQVSFVGYQSQRLSLPLQSDTSVVIKLQPQSQSLREVVINAAENTPLHSLGKSTIPLSIVKEAPALLGEADLLKTIQFLPGVQAGTEGTVGINVRGGSPDQNLILLDGVPVYNINHLFGFFSVMNPDAVAQVDFHKGHLPSRFGGRLSSVIDIALREGNQEKWTGNFSVSPLTSHLTLEGPLKKDKSALLVSARSSWINALINLGTSLVGSSSNTTFGLYDINAKWNYRFSRKDHVFASFYTGNDRFANNFKLDNSIYRFQFNWGNTTTALRWNRVWHENLFSNLTAYYSNYRYQLSEKYDSEKNFSSEARSGIKDYGLRLQLEQSLSARHALNYGVNLVHHTFSPELQQYKTGVAPALNSGFAPIESLEWSAYAEDQFHIKPNLKLEAGVHYLGQAVEGKTFHQLQPRLNVNWIFTPRHTFQASYNRTAQFLHLLTNASLGLPTDLWVPATPRLGPERAHQYSLGYAYQVSPKLRLTTEAYYKTLDGVLEYKEGSSFLNNSGTPWQEKVSIGKGQSQGLELALEKTTGRLKGWVSYTLSKTDREFPDLNGGRPFPFKYDRRHNLALVGTYAFNTRKSISINFVYNSGNRLTLPTSAYEGVQPNENVDDPGFYNNESSFFESLGDMTNRNNFSSPAYHRLDVSYRSSKFKKQGKRSWVFGLYNAYNQLNPFFVYYQKHQLRQFTLLPVIPSVAYQREF